MKIGDAFLCKNKSKVLLANYIKSNNVTKSKKNIKKN